MTRNAQREVEAVREQLQPQWDSAREQRVWARLRDERVAAVAHQRRGWARLGLAGATLAAGAAAVLALGLWTPSDPPQGSLAGAEHGTPAASELEPSQAEADGGDFVSLPDGTKLRASASSRYELRRAEPGLVELEVVSGRLDFEVPPDPQRRFVVHAGEVQIEVVGTAFGVEREADTVAVTVSRGTVRVSADWREPVLLTRGERLELQAHAPPVPAHASPEGSPDSADAPAPANADTPTPPAPAPRATKADTRWLELADAGEHDEAWAALGGGFVDRKDPKALMAAADVARLTQHPKAAVGWLDVVIDDHARSPLAPLAAFTKGRLLLERLGDPAGAAEAFATAGSLAPEGPLAEDALARAVEALAKAGKDARARAQAERYVERYPDGHRLQLVRRWGGLD